MKKKPIKTRSKLNSPCTNNRNINFCTLVSFAWKQVGLTRRVPLVEQELLTLREHLRSPPVFSGVRVTRFLVLYVCFVDHCLSFCTFSFGQEDFQSFNQSEHIIGPGSHVGFPICTKITNLVENLPMNISAKFGPNLFSGFREEDENMKSLQMRTTPSTDAK